MTTTRAAHSAVTKVQVLTYLRAARHEASNGGFRRDATRTTAEIARAISKSASTARRHLWSLVDAGLVEACDGGASGAEGNPISWVTTNAAEASANG